METETSTVAAATTPSAETSSHQQLMAETPRTAVQLEAETSAAAASPPELADDPVETTDRRHAVIAVKAATAAQLAARLASVVDVDAEALLAEAAARLAARLPSSVASRLASVVEVAAKGLLAAVAVAQAAQREVETPPSAAQLEAETSTGAAATPPYAEASGNQNPMAETAQIAAQLEAETSAVAVVAAAPLELPDDYVETTVRQHAAVEVGAEALLAAAAAAARFAQLEVETFVVETPRSAAQLEAETPRSAAQLEVETSTGAVATPPSAEASGNQNPMAETAQTAAQLEAETFDVADAAAAPPELKDDYVETTVRRHAAVEVQAEALLGVATVARAAQLEMETFEVETPRSAAQLEAESSTVAATTPPAETSDHHHSSSWIAELLKMETTMWDDEVELEFARLAKSPSAHLVTLDAPNGEVRATSNDSKRGADVVPIVGLLVMMMSMVLAYYSTTKDASHIVRDFELIITIFISFTLILILAGRCFNPPWLHPTTMAFVGVNVLLMTVFVYLVIMKK